MISYGFVFNAGVHTHFVAYRVSNITVYPWVKW